MITVTKTDTHGFRAERFRNQVVHQYYGHLQSVMHSIEPTDIYKNLFARPEIDGFSTDNTNVEWTSALSGKPVHYSQLSELDQQKVDRFITEAFCRIDKYIADGKGKTGKEHDYSQFLSIVGKRPNPNQIWIIGGKPTIVQWGYNDENNLMGSSGIYPNWDSFISEIKTAQTEDLAVSVDSSISESAESEVTLKESAVVVASSLFAELPDEKTQTQEIKQEVKQVVKQEITQEVKQENNISGSKPKAQSKKPVKKQEEKMVMAGLGGYWWVKWLAIILLIIIIILLLLRLIPQAQSPFGQMPGMAGGPTVINGGAGGIGGGAGGIGGAPEGGAGGGIGGGAGNNGNGVTPQNDSKAAPEKSGPEDKDSESIGKEDSASINPEGLCPVCKNSFFKHSQEDLKKCLLNAHEGEEELKKKLQKFVSEFDGNTADKTTNNAADNDVDTAAEAVDDVTDNTAAKTIDNTAKNATDNVGDK